MENNYNCAIKFRCYITFLFLLLFCHVSFAHPFLWRVSGEHEFYLFGTIHLPDPSVTILPKEIDDALADSDVFYSELDLSEENTMLVRQSMWLPDKKNLYDFLPKDLEEQVNQYLVSINPELNLEFFAKQKIWVLAITLTVLEQQLKYPNHPPLDTVLYNRAVALGLDTGGLETVDEQLEVFTTLTTDQQLIFLRDTVEFMQSTLDDETSFIEQSLNNYLKGDLDSLMSNLMPYMKDNEFYEQLLYRLIDNRNLNITNKMLELLKLNPEKRYFFAVGAGHFWGENSIHSILKERGYTIQTIE